MHPCHHLHRVVWTLTPPSCYRRRRRITVRAHPLASNVVRGCADYTRSQSSIYTRLLSTRCFVFDGNYVEWRNCYIVHVLCVALAYFRVLAHMGPRCVFYPYPYPVDGPFLSWLSYYLPGIVPLLQAWRQMLKTKRPPQRASRSRPKAYRRTFYSSSSSMGAKTGHKAL
jgi:hypothetical protein